MSHVSFILIILRNTNQTLFRCLGAQRVQITIRILVSVKLRYLQYNTMTRYTEKHTILHALNTFPKVFFVWGILDLRPQRPVEMEEKLRKDFPHLSQFTFLNRNNFNQYCKRSLKEIVIQDFTYWEYNSFQREAPTWQLVDDSIQSIAGFLLAKCVELGVNCESFLASRKNSSPKYNFDRIQVLLDLYQNGSQQASALANSSSGGWDIVGKCRHLDKLSEAGLIERTTFSSVENHIGYQWVPDKKPDEICYDDPDDGVDKYSIAIKRISEVLSNSDWAVGPAELARLAGYESESYIKGAIRKLYRQGFVLKLNKGNYSVCRLTEAGKAVVKHAIKPLVLGLEGVEDQVDWFGNTEPTKEHLVTAMEMYAKGLGS